MRRLPILALALALVAIPLAAREPTLEELIAHAKAAPLKEQPALYVEIAERQLKSADELYVAGKVEEARQSVADIVTYSEKAHDAAIQSGKRLKSVEMALRKMAHRLKDVRRTLNFEDQAPVAEASERLDKLADDLLAKMFGKEK
jgi:polyhydroxyalkanoate synthesis regulator phasin